MSTLPAAFVEAIEAEREALNQRFALRQRAGVKIDADALLLHLREAVAPLVAATHTLLPERTRSVTLALYDVSLDLFAAGLLGPEAKLPDVARVWKDVLPRTAKLLAREPQQVAGCLSNAMFQIASQCRLSLRERTFFRGAKDDTWLTRMAEVAGECATVEQLLHVGRIAAWQAGMVQLRTAALEAAKNLPPQLAAMAMGLPRTTPSEDIRRVIETLNNQPWLTADAALVQKPSFEPRCICTAGAFTGFGGQFAAPPHVTCKDGRLLVADGISQWKLYADAYGTWLCRIGDAPPRRAAKPPPEVSLDQRGQIVWNKQLLVLPQLAGATSFACDGATLAVTIPTSHHVFLIGRAV